MTPTLLAEYISAVLLTLSAVFWVNLFIAVAVGLLDKDDPDKDNEP